MKEMKKRWGYGLPVAVDGLGRRCDRCRHFAQTACDRVTGYGSCNRFNWCVEANKVCDGFTPIGAP